MAEADEGDIATALGGVGARLRRAREAAGRSLADVAARTRVSERYLSAIEEGRFADLASRTYAVGFARAYARDVNLDELAVANEVRAELNRHGDVERPRPVTFDYGDPARVPRRALAWLAALAAVVVAVAVFFVWRSYYDPAVPLGDLAPVASPVPTRTPSVGPRLAAATPPAAASGAVVFTAAEPGIWVKFYDASGKQLMQKQMAQGEAYTVPADAVGPKLWTGRPDALRITIGGKPVAPISTKQMRVKNVSIDAASLLKRAPVVGPSAAAPGTAPLPRPPAATPAG